MTTETTTQLRRCVGSKTFGIEAHEAPANEFPTQPSQKDGLGRMCKPHWRQYTNALRKAAVARKAAEAEVAPAPPPVVEPEVAPDPGGQAADDVLEPGAPTPRRTRRAKAPAEPKPTAA